MMEQFGAGVTIAVSCIMVMFLYFPFIAFNVSAKFRHGTCFALLLGPYAFLYFSGLSLTAIWMANLVSVMTIL